MGKVPSTEPAVSQRGEKQGDCIGCLIVKSNFKYLKVSWYLDEN